jgi:hypothetical protein|tara:strand:- start:375 stop:509 length:135 start_codon:yes stop_codon:yes gene_type:complete
MLALVDPFALKYDLASNTSPDNVKAVFFSSLQREMAEDTHVNGT